MSDVQDRAVAGFAGEYSKTINTAGHDVSCSVCFSGKNRNTGENLCCPTTLKPIPQEGKMPKIDNVGFGKFTEQQKSACKPTFVLSINEFVFSPRFSLAWLKSRRAKLY